MNPSFGEQERNFGRRDFLAWGFKMAVGAVVIQSCSSPEGNAVADLPPETTEETVSSGRLPRPTVTNRTIPETTEHVTTTTSEAPATTAESTTTTTDAPATTEAPTWESEHYLPKEVLVEGTKLADLSITNPDGNQIVNVPLFVATHIDNPEFNNPLLERGALLEVAHPDINPEEIGDINPAPDNLATPQIGLIGENGLATIFGHRVSRINPDWDGDPANGNEGARQKVFEDLDKLQTGARLSLQLTQAAGGEALHYELTGTHIIEDYELAGGGSLVEVAKQWRLGPSDNQYLRLMACHPKGSTQDRIAAEFVRIV